MDFWYHLCTGVWFVLILISKAICENINLAELAMTCRLAGSQEWYCRLAACELAQACTSPGKKSVRLLMRCCHHFGYLYICFLCRLEGVWGGDWDWDWRGGRKHVFITFCKSAMQYTMQFIQISISFSAIRCLLWHTPVINVSLQCATLNNKSTRICNYIGPTRSYGGYDMLQTWGDSYKVL